jgi:hypothetical protein
MHRYAAPGIYTVSLAAFDQWGNMGWFTTDITVGSEAPISVEERTEWWIDNQAFGAIVVFIGALVIASIYVGVIGPRKGGVHWAIMMMIGAVALVLILQIYGVIA